MISNVAPHNCPSSSVVDKSRSTWYDKSKSPEGTHKGSEGKSQSLKGLQKISIFANKYMVSTADSVYKFINQS